MIEEVFFLLCAEYVLCSVERDLLLMFAVTFTNHIDIDHHQSVKIFSCIFQNILEYFLVVWESCYIFATMMM